MSGLAGAAEALRAAQEQREREAAEVFESGPVAAVVRIEAERDQRLARAEARFWEAFMAAFGAAASPRRIG